MSRIRSIKPEWLDDEALATASDAARVLSIALICLADDYGNGRAGRVWLAARVFPGRPLETLDEALRELVALRYVFIYEVDGQRYFAIRTWDKNQRVDKPGLPKVPRPNLATDGSYSGIPEPEDSRESPENFQEFPEIPSSSRASPSLPLPFQDPVSALPDPADRSGSARARRKPSAKPKPDPVPFPMRDDWAPNRELVEALATKFSVTPARIAAELPEFRYFWKQRGDRRKAQGWERAFTHRIERQANTQALYAGPPSWAPGGSVPHVNGNGHHVPDAEAEQRRKRAAEVEAKAKAERDRNGRSGAPANSGVHPVAAKGVS